MSRPAQILTANRLRDGEVVYWRQGAWVSQLPDADVLTVTAATKALEAAARSVADRLVVNPYLFEIRADGRPVKEREQIRAAGPSVRADLGKQADDHVSI